MAASRTSAPCRHLLAVGALSKSEIVALLDRADALRASAPPAPARPPIVGLLFDQASYRTQLSFAVAAARLGGCSVQVEPHRFTEDMSAPESFSDRVRVASGQVDVLVTRTPAALNAALVGAVARCPVINAGDGRHEHPTQALCDLFAIRMAHGRLTGLRVGLCGDLTTRVSHSLLAALAQFHPTELRLMSPVSRSLDVDSGNLAATATRRDELDASGLDVLYMAGLAPGTGPDRLAAEQRARFILDERALDRLPTHGVVLCPLPRIDEIAPCVDADPRAAYFAQCDDGLWVRMAVLEAIVRPSWDTDLAPPAPHG